MPVIELITDEIFEAPTTAPVISVFELNKKKVPTSKNTKLKKLKYFFLRYKG